jgi:hypothetical protein
MSLAIWNVFTVPINVAFEPEQMGSIYVLVINAIIDVMFLVDILVNFRTTFLNPLSGDEIYDPREIAINYLKTRFSIDLLATIPFDQLGEAIFNASNT